MVQEDLSFIEYSFVLFEFYIMFMYYLFNKMIKIRTEVVTSGDRMEGTDLKVMQDIKLTEGSACIYRKEKEKGNKSEN